MKSASLFCILVMLFDLFLIIGGLLWWYISPIDGVFGPQDETQIGLLVEIGAAIRLERES